MLWLHRRASGSEQTLFFLGETKPGDVVQPSVDVCIPLGWIAGPQHQLFKSTSVGLHRRNHQRFPAVCFNSLIKKHNLTVLQGCFFLWWALPVFLESCKPLHKIGCLLFFLRKAFIAKREEAVHLESASFYLQDNQKDFKDSFYIS